MKFADLHTHTHFSDGGYTPPELVAGAKKAGLAAVALTDHDTMAGVAPTITAGKAAGVEVIAGVEITCRADVREVHLLGYFFDDNWKSSTLANVLDHARREREQRVAQFIHKLNELGMPLTIEDVRAAAGAGTLGRPHVALALVRRQHVRSAEEAFERFLRRGQPAFVERYRMTVAEAIGHVQRAGGVAVLAHPGLNRVDDKLHEMRDQGLDGVEVWHSKHSPSQTAHYLKLAEQLSLLATGGSDDHGPGRDFLIGTVKIPYDRVEALKLRALQHINSA